MRERGELPDLIFASPALRSVQTAVAMRRGLGTSELIKVEPAIYEFFTRTELPPLLATADYAQAGLPVDAAYQPCRKPESLSAPEPFPAYYQRLRDFILWLCERYPGLVFPSLLLLSNLGKR